MKTISLLETASYLPPNRVGVEYFEQYVPASQAAKSSPMFRPPRYRRHSSRDDTALEYVERAAATLFERIGPAHAREVDILITQNGFPDQPHIGMGALVAHRLGCRPQFVIDLHSGHCASLPLMIELAQQLMNGSSAKLALLCHTNLAAGFITTQPANRVSIHHAIPGDGCGVALIGASNESPILGTEVRHLPEYAPDIAVLKAADRKWWEPGTSQLDYVFDRDKLKKVIEVGNQLVPDVVRGLFAKLSRPLEDIGLLVTNQPNRQFLSNWSAGLGAAPEKHFETFDEYGNLFGAGMTVNFDHALRAGRVREDSLVVFGGFAGSGELASAAAVHWKAKL